MTFDSVRRIDRIAEVTTRDTRNGCNTDFPVIKLLDT